MFGTLFSKAARDRARIEKFETAIFWKDVAKIEHLLSQGADPNGRGRRQYHLGRAVEGQSLQVIKLLLDAGADPRMPFRIDGFEATMSEGAQRIGASAEVIELLKRAEKQAVATRGPGPEPRRPPTDSCCFVPK